MISVVLYGRNDQHGYNSHRRVALSLNAIAEVLTGSSDEIIFVDYNTPFGLPTLPEAIEDTLSNRVLDLLRIFRVSADLHSELLGDRSNLPISEPLARNVAIRRARRGNWILSTNTDMVFVPRADKSLTDLVSGLDGDAYCLPRFEIPEWLWEAVPRDDPMQIISLLRDWGERIGLDEVTFGHDWIIYDAPGDFQLLRRSLIEEIHGFDEDMIHGWHVDSNLWKRVHNRIRHIGTLYPEIAGYHTNHNRTLTRLVATQPTGNDLGRFVYEVTHSELPAQAASWGLPDALIPELSLSRPDLASRLRAASARAPGQEGPLIPSDTREQLTALGYDARHVLPFLLDPLLAERPLPGIGYVGINESTATMLGEAASLLGCPGHLARDDEAAANADVVVLDLGIDVSHPNAQLGHAESEELLLRAERAHDALRHRMPQPRVLIINGSSGIWADWVDAHFNTLYGTFHSRLQAAECLNANNGCHRGRIAFAVRDRSRATLARADARGACMAFTTPWTFDGADGGWGVADDHGMLMRSDRAAIDFRTESAFGAGTLVILELACWTTSTGPIDPLVLEVDLDDRPLFRETLNPIPQILHLHERLPGEIGHKHRLSFQVRTADGSPYQPFLTSGVDPWLRVGGLRLAREQDAMCAAGPRILPMSPGSEAESMLRGVWTKTNPYGAWAVATGSWIRLANTMGGDKVLLEVLRHPDRVEQGIRLIASGGERLETELHDISSVQPSDQVLDLPPPDEGGGVSLLLEPNDPPAPSGEVIEVRGIGVLRTPSQTRSRWPSWLNA